MKSVEAEVGMMIMGMLHTLQRLPMADMMHTDTIRIYHS
jgi:hypothetical protein